MFRRDRGRLDIAGDGQLSRIKPEQAILNFFDGDQLGNRLSILRDNEFCLPCLHFIHNCQALGFERSRRNRFQEQFLTMVIIPWSYRPGTVATKRYSVPRYDNEGSHHYSEGTPQ